MLGIHVILGSAIEIQGKATSFANPTFHFDTSSHLGKHLLYERQPQPRAFVVSGKRCYVRIKITYQRIETPHKFLQFVWCYFFYSVISGGIYKTPNSFFSSVVVFSMYCKYLSVVESLLWPATLDTVIMFTPEAKW